MNCVSYVWYMRVYTTLFVCVFSLGYSSTPECDGSLSCDHGLDYAS